jgi:hypothetical protein
VRPRPRRRGLAGDPRARPRRLLRDAFADLDFEIHTVVAEGDLVVVHNTMRGVHARALGGYEEDGTVDQAFPTT